MLWKCDSTYCLLHYDNVPQIEDVPFAGQFQWLAELDDGEYPMMNEQLSKEEAQVQIKQLLSNLTKEAKAKEVDLPDDFVYFFTSPELQIKIPSCTANYFELSENLLPSPTNDGGYLIRFMNDSQVVALWYLYLHPNGQQFVTTGFSEWKEEYDDDAKFDEVLKVPEMWICALSFEEFIYRYWLENKIWFSYYKKRELTGIQKEYSDKVKLANQDLQQF